MSRKQILDRHYKKNKEKIIAYTNNWRISNPKKRRAHKTIEAALKAGRIHRLPCWTCGKEKTDAHHYDYDSPMDVTWLCRKHHRQTHDIAKIL